MKYKNWEIEKNEVGQFEANRSDNSNEFFLHAKTLDEIKTEIDDLMECHKCGTELEERRDYDYCPKCRERRSKKKK